MLETKPDSPPAAQSGRLGFWHACRQMTVSFGRRLLFLFLCSLILVISSERAYWYFSSEVVAVAVYYMIPTVLFLWAVEHFNVNSLPRLFIAACLFGFFVEGIIATQVYGESFFDVFAISYTSISWHAIFSIMLFWYYFRKWCLEKKAMPLISSAVLFGIIWGSWNAVILSGEDDPTEVNTAPFTPDEFGIYAAEVTLALLLAHWLMNFFWCREFRISLIEKVLYLGLALYVFVTLPVMEADIWYAPIVLGVLVAASLLLLSIQKDEHSVLERLSGKASVLHLLLLLFMPLSAYLTYGFILSLELSRDDLSFIFRQHVAIDFYLGYVFLALAVTGIFLRKRKELRNK